MREFLADSISSVRLALTTTASSNASKPDVTAVGPLNLAELIANLYQSTMEKVRGVLQDLLIFVQPDLSFQLRRDPKGAVCIEGIREHLLVGFLKHAALMMRSVAADVRHAGPPNLHLVLSKTCLEFDRTGVRQLLAQADELYGIESGTLTPETLLCAEMRTAAQQLLDTFVRLQGLNMSQMLRKSVETRDWLNCLEPRSVRAVMKRCVEELGDIEVALGDLFETGTRTSASSDSSRKTLVSNLVASKQQQQFRSTWSNYTPASQLENSFASNVHRLFSERIEIFSSVEFSKVSIVTGIVKISLKVSLCILYV